VHSSPITGDEQLSPSTNFPGIKSKIKQRSKQASGSNVYLEKKKKGKVNYKVVN
jgi:hypothetical protein